jgi:hypothetical protein
VANNWKETTLMQVEEINPFFNPFACLAARPA